MILGAWQTYILPALGCWSRVSPSSLLSSSSRPYFATTRLIAFSKSLSSKRLLCTNVLLLLIQPDTVCPNTLVMFHPQTFGLNTSFAITSYSSMAWEAVMCSLKSMMPMMPPVLVPPASSK